MRVRWTPEASSNLKEIVLYIAKDSPAAASRAAEDIFRGIEQLPAFPRRGRPGREPGTRELVLFPSPYLAVYRVKGSVIEILRIWHGAQDRERSPRSGSDI